MNRLLVLVIVAAGWVGIRARFDPGTLLLALLIGLFFVWILRRRLRGGPSPVVLPRFLWGATRAFVLLIGEIVVSNVQQLAIVLRPRLHLRSSFAEMETRLQTPAFRATLGVTLSMTPLTNYCDDRHSNGRILLVHFLDTDDVEASIERVRRSLEEPLLYLERLWLT